MTKREIRPENDRRTPDSLGREVTGGWRLIDPKGIVRLGKRKATHQSLQERIGELIYVEWADNWGNSLKAYTGQPGRLQPLCTMQPIEPPPHYRVATKRKHNDRSKPIDQDMRRRENRIREGKPLQSPLKPWEKQGEDGDRQG